MKIAQIAPLIESVPPRYYGGTERVISYLTEELVRMGHEVTLFATGDSRTAARLVSCAPRSLRGDPDCHDTAARHVLELERVLSKRDRFEIFHFHMDYLPFPTVRHLGLPTLTTLHGRLDTKDLSLICDEYRDIPVVAISDNQRECQPQADWQGTVYHGLPRNLLSAGTGRGKYLAFLGRISPEKRPDSAIEIARRAGIPLKIAAKVDAKDREYYRTIFEPMMRLPGVDFIGEVTEREKERLLGNALGLLFPIDWPEPFGLSLIESMACGTPVIAFDRGSVPEIIEDRVTGFIVSGVNEAVEAVGQLHHIDRARCRREFERRFSAQRMAMDYLAIYKGILGRNGYKRARAYHAEER